MTVSQLRPGTRFELLGESYELIRANVCRAVIRKCARKHVRVKPGVEFDRPAETLSISPGTEVSTSVGGNHVDG